MSGKKTTADQQHFNDVLSYLETVKLSSTDEDEDEDTSTASTAPLRQLRCVAHQSPDSSKKLVLSYSSYDFLEEDMIRHYMLFSSRGIQNTVARNDNVFRCPMNPKCVWRGIQGMCSIANSHIWRKHKDDVINLNVKTVNNCFEWKNYKKCGDGCAFDTFIKKYNRYFYFDAKAKNDATLINLYIIGDRNTYYWNIRIVNEMDTRLSVAPLLNTDSDINLEYPYFFRTSVAEQYSQGSFNLKFKISFCRGQSANESYQRISIYNIQKKRKPCKCKREEEEEKKEKI